MPGTEVGCGLPVKWGEDGSACFEKLAANRRLAEAEGAASGQLQSIQGEQNKYFHKGLSRISCEEQADSYHILEE